MRGLRGWRVTSAWSAGLSTSTAASGLASSTLRMVEAEPPPDRGQRLVERAQPQHRAEQQRRPERGDHPPALLAVLLDRPPQRHRLGRLARCRRRTGSRPNKRRRETGARCASSAAGAPSSARSLDQPDGEVGACRLARRNRRSSPRRASAWSAVVTSKGKRVAGSARIASSVAAMVAPDASTVSRGSSGSTAAIRSGCCASTRTALDFRRGEQRRDRPRHHRHAADRDQRLQVGAMRCGERIGAGPRPGQHQRGPAAHASQLMTCRPRSARALACASRTAWKISDRIVHSATSSIPRSGRPNSSDDDQDHHVGVAPRGDQPEAAVDRLPDVDVHPVAAHEDALDHALRDIAEHDRADDQQFVDRDRRAARP